MATQRFEICNGPAKWDLMLSLFDGTSTNPRLARFQVHELFGAKTFIPILINGVSREDGSGEKWIFTGYVDGKPAKGFFSTQDRHGWIELDVATFK